MNTRPRHPRGEILEKRSEPREIVDILVWQLRCDWMAHSHVPLFQTRWHFLKERQNVTTRRLGDIKRELLELGDIFHHHFPDVAALAPSAALAV